MSQKNNVYCPLIYQGMYVERRDSENSLVAPCCAAKGELFPNDQIDFDSNIFLQRLRKENAAGIASAECRECWNSEKYQDTSRRIMSLRMSKLTDSIFDSSDHSFVNLFAVVIIVVPGPPRIADSLVCMNFKDHFLIQNAMT